MQGQAVLIKCSNAFFLNKLGTRQQGNPDRNPNRAVNSDDVQRECVNEVDLGDMYELHQPIASIAEMTSFQLSSLDIQKKN